MISYLPDLPTMARYNTRSFFTHAYGPRKKLPSLHNHRHTGINITLIQVHLVQWGRCCQWVGILVIGFLLWSQMRWERYSAFILDKRPRSNDNFISREICREQTFSGVAIIGLVDLWGAESVRSLGLTYKIVAILTQCNRRNNAI